MKTYKVKNWPVIDDDGKQHEDGDLVELSDEKADFYSGRLIEVDDEGSNEPDSDLPEDLPYRSKFVDAGYSFSDVLQSEDLTEVNGIGDSYAESVREYLDEEVEDEQSNSG